VKVKATKKLFEYAEQKFDVGLINSVDFNNSKKEYNNALIELAQSKYDYVFRSIIIDFYLGKPLSFNR
jgi:outer membrane protein